MTELSRGDHDLRRGSWYTPQVVARALVKMAVEEVVEVFGGVGGIRVVDPAVGDGIFPQELVAAGFRPEQMVLVDVDEDGYHDIVFSNAERYSVDLWTPSDSGWTRRVMAGEQGDEHALPPIVRADGTNNGVWFNHRHMWVQNEQRVRTVIVHPGGSFLKSTGSKLSRSFNERG